MRKKTIIPILLLLLFAACAKVNTDELNQQIVVSNSDYDSVSVFVTSQLAALKLIVDNGGILSDAEKQRAIDLYAVLQVLDSYKDTVEALKVDPTLELFQQASELSTEFKEKATALGWEATQ